MFCYLFACNLVMDCSDMSALLELGQSILLSSVPPRLERLNAGHTSAPFTAPLQRQKYKPGVTCSSRDLHLIHALLA